MIRHDIKGLVGGGAATMADGPIAAYRDTAARAASSTSTLHLDLHPQQVMLEQFQWMAQEVMPAFEGKQPMAAE